MGTIASRIGIGLSSGLPVNNLPAGQCKSRQEKAGREEGLLFFIMHGSDSHHIIVNVSSPFAFRCATSIWTALRSEGRASVISAKEHGSGKV